MAAAEHAILNSGVTFTHYLIRHFVYRILGSAVADPQAEISERVLHCPIANELLATRA